ncbi:hypothetical protein HGI10_66770 [Streptomyces collinus]|nr:hypothetical protein HGI10_00170 [Streptomyces collinus]UJA12692.1 hypothetical protein HGI10_66770 [Streptomyces collinus]
MTGEAVRQPHLSGSVGRRLLVNRRAVPEAAARLLPWPPRPQVVRAVAPPAVRNAPMGRRPPPGPTGVPHNAAPANSGR